MPKRLVKVSIAYCAECGYEPQTLALTEALMKEFRHELSEIELIPWYEGSFDVTVDGELVHSMFRDGGFADHQAVIDAVRRHQAEAPEHGQTPAATAPGA
ncbi:MAG TPA: Rdx family protein [Ktedonobacterales bacterium]|jgi:selenoprotein W-related protein|nr:Rdx family protein [Ktedonobacterales bacterium]